MGLGYDLSIYRLRCGVGCLGRERGRAGGEESDLDRASTTPRLDVMDPGGRKRGMCMIFCSRVRMEKAGRR